MRSKKTLTMVQVGILTAIVLVMSFTPLGYLHIGPFSMSLLSIPVVIGAMLVGPEAGALLGLVFGLTSFAQCFGADPFGATLLNINPFGTFFMCVPTRMLMGYLAGMIFKGLRKVDKTRTVCYFVGGISGAVLNTVFFMGAMLLFFWTSDYIQGMSGGAGIFGFLVTMVGLQGVLEALICCAAGGAISKAVSKALKRE